MKSLKSKQQKFQATLAIVFALAAGVSFAVVAPQRAAQHTRAPAVTLPTIVVKPDAADIAAAKADPAAKSASTQASL
jgi:hypothetical protein